MFSTNIKNRIYIFCSVIIYLLFLLSIFFSIKNLYLTNDESFTFCLIHKSFSHIIYYTSMDVHPFLYYFVAKIFILPFKGILLQIISLRILSAIPYAILLIIGNISIRHKFGKLVSLLFMFSIFTMPLLAQYVYIIRMYSFSMLFITISFILFVYLYYGFLKESINVYLLISLCSLLAMYSHYVALIDLLIIYFLFIVLFALSHKQIKYIFLSGFIVVIGYIPWIFTLLHQVRNAQGSFWSSRVTISNIIITFYQIFSPLSRATYYTKIGYSVFISVFIILFMIVFFVYKGYKNIVLNFGLLLLLSNFVIFLLVSLYVHHTIFISRYFVLLLGILYLSISLFIGNVLQDHKYNKFIYTIVVLFLGIGIFSYFVNININMNGTESQFKPTFTLIKHIPQNAQIIYGAYSNTPISTLSSYTHNNIILSNHVKLYDKVFNFKTKHNIKLHRHVNYYFVKPISSETKYGERFYKYNKFSLRRIGMVKSPDSHNMIKSTLYKIDK